MLIHTGRSVHPLFFARFSCAHPRPLVVAVSPSRGKTRPGSWAHQIACPISIAATHTSSIQGRPVGRLFEIGKCRTMQFVKPSGYLQSRRLRSTAPHFTQARFLDYSAQATQTQAMALGYYIPANCLCDNFATRAFVMKTPTTLRRLTRYSPHQSVPIADHANTPATHTKSTRSHRGEVRLTSCASNLRMRVSHAKSP